MRVRRRCTHYGDDKGVWGNGPRTSPYSLFVENQIVCLAPLPLLRA